MWIDLNNDGFKDAGETVTAFGETASYTLASQTLTIHGMISGGYDSGQLKTLDVRKNSALRLLSCLGGFLTSLDLTQNKELGY